MVSIVDGERCVGGWWVSFLQVDIRLQKGKIEVNKNRDCWKLFQ